MRIHVEQIEHHRNGASGAPFYAIVFTSTDEYGPGGTPVRYLATVFERAIERLGRAKHGITNPECAVLQMDLLPDVTFGVNSHRGDYFFPVLAAAIRAHNEYVAEIKDYGSPTWAERYWAAGKRGFDVAA